MENSTFLLLKKRAGISAHPLDVICLLVEVTLQHALQSLAMAGLVLILLIAMLKSRNISFQKVQFPMDFP